ncbi:MAG TPA: EAL domain-containing protein [Noviherbaspirillum sp.]
MHAQSIRQHEGYEGRAPARRGIGGVAGVLLAALFVCAVANVMTVRSAFRGLDAADAALGAATRLAMLSQRIAFDMLAHAASAGGAHRASADIAEFDATLELLERAGPPPMEGNDQAPALRAQLAALRTGWAAYRTQIDAWLTRSGASTRVPDEENRPLEASATQVQEDAGELGRMLSADAHATRQRTLAILYGLLLLDALLLLTAFAVFRRRVVMPLRQLARACRELADGRFETRFTSRSDDEIGALAAALDLTARQLDARFGQSELAYRHSSDGMAIADPSGVILHVNPAFTTITGYAEEDIVGKRFSMLNSGRHDKAFYQAMWQSLSLTGRWRGEIWNRRSNGDIYAEWLSIDTCFHADGTPYRRIATFSDITHRKRSDEQMWRQANYDALTGLPNRRLFHDRLAQAILKASRTGLPLALMFLDLDRFKEVNDTLGHSVGDILLKEAAQRISSCVRESDTVARLGGDEFTIILGDLSATGNVERIAQDLLRRLSEPFLLGAEVAYISSSIGITLFPDDATQLDDLLKNADQAMYAAKERGRNRYSYFTRSMQENAQFRRRLAVDMRTALGEGQFRLHYQPIVELATGAVGKAEALLRWQHPTLGLLAPAEFIPIAEETGIIVDIGSWVFEEAARQVAHWRTHHDAGFQITVNTSPVQYRSSDFSAGALTCQLDTLRLPGESIIVELTEHMLTESSDSISPHLAGFQQAGIQVSLDEFGAGYSSLSYLKNLHIDYLKIDRAFVSRLAPGSTDLALAEAIIALAHKMGLKVIAEGVETASQRDMLAAAGCDYAQGFLFSRPVPAEHLGEMLARRSDPGFLDPAPWSAPAAGGRIS